MNIERRILNIMSQSLKQNEKIAYNAKNIAGLRHQYTHFILLVQVVTELY